MPGKEIEPSSGFLNELVLRLKLIVKLMGDRRVSPFVKLIPIATMVYLVSPIDFLPLNPLDDAGIVGLGFYLFIELCPNSVVQEYMDDMRRVVIPGEWKEIIDQEPQEKKEN